MSYWILGMDGIGASPSVIAIDATGAIESLEIGKLKAEHHVPAGAVVRRVFEGTWEDWKPGSAEPFLDAMRVPQPHWGINRHQVFQASIRGQTWHIPALSILKAMCGRSKDILSRVFVPSGMEDLVLMDYRATPPKPVLVENTPFAANLCATEKLFLRWLTGSISATNAFNFALTSALRGTLDFPLPMGKVKFSARGVEVDGSFFVGSIEIAEVTVRPSDSLAGGAAHHVLSARAANGNLGLPYNDYGDARTTEFEWDELWPILRTDTLVDREYEVRSFLDEILKKYVFGWAWADLETEPRPFLFKWKQSGRWSQVLDVLSITREGNERYAPDVLRVQTVFMF